MTVLANSLITLAEFKEFQPGITTQYDKQIEATIDGVSEAFNSYLHRTLAKSTYTGVYFNGNGMRVMILPNAPVIVSTGTPVVKENAVTLTEGIAEDYILDAERGFLWKPVGGYWSDGLKTIQITYTAGYVVQGGTVTAPDIKLPADLKLACLIQVGYFWNQAKLAQWGQTSLSLPDGSMSRLETDLLTSVKTILDSYTRHRI